MCGTEVGEMNEIHVLLPVFFPAFEVFVGMNAVDTVTFASPDVFVSRVAFEEVSPPPPSVRGVPIFLVFATNAVLPVHITPPPWLWWQGVTKNRMFI
jgi:hypothetical protein